jgi:DNA-binding LytR/AlgR family response regulator
MMKTSTNSILIGPIARQEEVKFDEILYFKADSNYTEIHVLNKKLPYVISNTLKEVQNQINDARFYRINRGHLINIEYISMFGVNSHHEVNLKTGDQFNVAVRRKTGFKNFLKGKKMIP